MKKRIVTLLLTFVITIISLLKFNVIYADGSIEISATTSSSVTQGSSATCNIYTSSLEDVSSINITIYFNSNNVSINNTYNSVTALLYDSSVNSDNVNYSYIFDGNGEATKTKLFYFNFTVLNNATPGEDYFDIIVTDAYDSSLNELDVVANRTTFNINEKIVQKTCRIYSSSNTININPGEEFEYYYYFSTQEIASGSVNIVYDFEYLELKDYTYENLLSNKMVDINTNINGSIYLSFLGTEYANSNKLITLKFKAIKNGQESSDIVCTVNDLYDNDLNLITCSTKTVTVNISYDETFDKIIPEVNLSGELSNDNKTYTLTIDMDANSNLGAGDFVLEFDNEYLKYVSSVKGINATFFNINTKEVNNGTLKFSIISLQNIVDEATLLTITFDVNEVKEDVDVEFNISGSGLADALTNEIELSFNNLEDTLLKNSDYTVMALQQETAVIDNCVYVRFIFIVDGLDVDSSSLENKLSLILDDGLDSEQIVYRTPGSYKVLRDKGNIYETTLPNGDDYIFESKEDVSYVIYVVKFTNSKYVGHTINASLELNDKTYKTTIYTFTD